MERGGDSWALLLCKVFTSPWVALVKLQGAVAERDASALQTGELGDGEQAAELAVCAITGLLTLHPAPVLGAPGSWTRTVTPGCSR